MNYYDIKDIYKKYEPGTYENLTTDERMYYINLIKEGGDTHSYCTKFFEEPYDSSICDNMLEFFSDASRHISDKLSDAFCHKLICDGCDICPRFSTESFYRYLNSISFSDIEYIMVASVDYDQSGEEVIFDYRLFDENYLDEYIRETLQLGKVPHKYFEKIYAYHNQCNYL